MDSIFFNGGILQLVLSSQASHTRSLQRGESEKLKVDSQSTFRVRWQLRFIVQQSARQWTTVAIDDYFNPKSPVCDHFHRGNPRHLFKIHDFILSATLVHNGFNFMTIDPTLNLYRRCPPGMPMVKHRSMSGNH